MTALPDELTLTYFQFLLVAGKHEKVTNLLNSPINIDLSQKQTVELSSLMLTKNWETSSNFVLLNKETAHSDKYISLAKLSDEASHIPYKKPILAMSMSAIIPGTGKLYSGYSKDALIAFSMVAMNGWQAYRGFNKEGTKSVYGWIFASLSAGFYVGNIYGSYKAAKRRNLFFDNQMKHKAEHIIFR